MGNGEDTSFWHDTWLTDEPLAEKMPALFSHFVGRATSVRDIVHGGLRNMLQRRLSSQAAADLQLLDTLLMDVELDNAPDQRSNLFQDAAGKLHSGRSHVPRLQIRLALVRAAKGKVLRLATHKEQDQLQNLPRSQEPTSTCYL